MQTYLLGSPPVHPFHLKKWNVLFKMQVLRFSDADVQTEKEKELFSRVLFWGCYCEAGKRHLGLKFDQHNKNRPSSHHPQMWTWTEKTTAMLVSTGGAVNFHRLQLSLGIGCFKTDTHRQKAKPYEGNRSLKHLTSVSPVFLVNFKSANFHVYYIITIFTKLFFFYTTMKNLTITNPSFHLFPPTTHQNVWKKKKKRITKCMRKGHPPDCFKLDHSLHSGNVNFLQYTVYCRRALIFKIYIY